MIPADWFHGPTRRNGPDHPPRSKEAAIDILTLVQQRGIQPLLKSSREGGEYHGACPFCGDGGKGPASDRFHIWPRQKEGGTYWCRQCGKAGDLIRFRHPLLWDAPEDRLIDLWVLP